MDPAFEHGVLVDTGVAAVAGQETKQNELAYVPPGSATAVRDRRTTQPVRLLLLGGVPFGESIVMWWNFVGRTHDEIVAFREEWQAQITADGSVVADSQDVAEGRFGIVARRPPAPDPGARDADRPPQGTPLAPHCGLGYGSGAGHLNHRPVVEEVAQRPSRNPGTEGRAVAVTLRSSGPGDTPVLGQESGRMSDAPDFSGLKATYVNCTLKKSPEPSHTQGLVDASAGIMRKHGVDVDELRLVDHDVATGVYPDMREHGWETDAWPDLYPGILASDILVVAGPIWLGDNSSVTKQLIERIYALSGMLNDKGQYLFYGRVAGCLITGNEDGIKHCAQNILYSLQHVGYTIPPNADAGWIGEAGPGPSYLDPGSGGPENDFTNRNTTFMTWNLMHLARMLKDAGGVPGYGNQRSEWDAGTRFDWENPEYRS